MHRSRAHLVVDSEKQKLHRAHRDFERSVERSRALAKQAEDRAKAAVAPDGGIPTNSLEAQIGRPLDSAAIIKRLKTLNPNLRFEVSISAPDKMGIYLHKQFLFGFERGISPEFSVRHTNELNQFVGETRGWRTVIARLIMTRHISEGAADKAFGLPSRSSKNWKQAVH